ncbi:MAG: pyrroline-5-carboxylate reductase [Candidatus Omnitrophica bacterium]|nr:pyrroline-5-carboxylate reductase [Candidatus Omnitrophota bacterium]
MSKVKIGIIGFGNMGSAIAERIKKDYSVSVLEKDATKIIGISWVRACADIAELMNNSDAVILAVKPQDFEGVLNEIRPYIKEKLVISIAAGITIAYIEKALGKARVIRAMPNLAAQIGEGVSGLCKGRFADGGDLDLAWKLLSYVGLTISFDKEEMIDAVTAVSGSGPAYFCHYIKNKESAESKKDEFTQKLTQAAISIGFDKVMARRLSERTVEGTISTLIEKHLSCEELIRRVASKGGTTEAALALLDKGSSLEEAVKAALERAKELSKE